MKVNLKRMLPLKSRNKKCIHIRNVEKQFIEAKN